MKIKNIFKILILSIGLLTIFTGCDKKSEIKTIKIAYVNWAGTIALTNLAKVVLESEMNFKVELTAADVAPVYASVANGDRDIFLGAWLPYTHESYIEQYGDKLEDLGPNFKGTKIGLVVPSYVDINSITELNSIKDKMNNEIVGIDAGAGIMKKTEETISTYQLDYKLLPSSGPAMTAALKGAIDNNEFIVVTGWKPHWKFARFELKFLEDPKGIFGEGGDIKSLARLNFSKDMPEAAEFFKNMVLTNDQMSSLMDQIEQSEKSPDIAAKEWMNKNMDAVKSWIPSKI